MIADQMRFIYDMMDSSFLIAEVAHTNENQRRFLNNLLKVIDAKIVELSPTDELMFLLATNTLLIRLEIDRSFVYTRETSTETLDDHGEWKQNSKYIV
jgi:hypothetical protein